MILSREVWATATGRYAERTSGLSPVNTHMNSQGRPCIALTGTLDDYLALVEALAWVQYGSTPLLALGEVRFLVESTLTFAAVSTPDPEVCIWYLPNVHVAGVVA